MKRLLWLVIPVLALAFSGTALAQDKAAAAKTAVGVVKTVSGDSLVVTADKDMTFVITPTTKFVGKGLSTKTKEKGGKITAADAVAIGDRVTVKYTQSGDTMHASEVRLDQKALKK